MRVVWSAFSLILFLSWSISQSVAGVYSFTSAPTAYDSPLSLGFQFTPNTAVTITQLGYYDFQGDGLATVHEVGIFDSTGTLLTSVEISSGTLASLEGAFRYASIAPLNLAAGATYVLAATSNGECESCTAGRDPWVYGGPNNITGFSVDPRITIGQNAGLFDYQTDNILRNPTQHFGDYVIYAGNFDIASAVPELSTWLMMLLGFGGIGFMGYRRTRLPVLTN